MRAIVKRSVIDGSIDSPPSKSYTHRAIVCGLLSTGTTLIRNPLFCDDTEVTLRLSEMMGAKIDQGKDLKISGPDELQAPASEMDCRGSGTTLRIFTALSSLANGRCVLTGDETLRRRPIEALLAALRQLGIDADSIGANGRPPVVVHGGEIIGGVVKIPGNVTSQYITGLLYACSRAPNDTKIEITTVLESRPYVEMTLEVMEEFGVLAEPSDDWNHINIAGDQEYQSSEYRVQGDYSSAAFLMAAGGLTGRANVKGLGVDTVQGDADIAPILQGMGSSVELTGNGLSISKGELFAVDIDVSNTPDLAPVLAVLATQAKGITKLFNGTRLRLKESDRIATTTLELRKMGASIQEYEDGITISGPTPLRGAVVNPHDDHRVAMACMVAGLVADGTTVVENAECITKSYPNFIKDIQSIGAQIELDHNNSTRGGKK
ncbi:MAG: 3-phosphoshikimate 1-carboxyvinyltransferase [Candidatus Thorarchaeota archaeon]